MSETEKELEAEFVGLKEEFLGVKSKIDDLINKYSSLEKKYEKNVRKSKIVNFKCNNCGDKFESVVELKEHKDEGCQGEFECDECERKFKKESRLEKHKKTHEKFECGDCDKVFKKELTLDRHITAAHENITLFCHYFNNEEDCPFEDECVFVHEESDVCKFGKACERILCMYKHERRNSDENDDNDGSDDESESDDSDDELEVDIEELKPVLGKLEEAFEKLSISLKKHFGPLKCDMCEFEAKKQNGLTMHKRAKHTKQ